jgi:hypothetical protein
MVEMDLQAIWLALATSGFVLLGFSALAASMVGSGESEVSRNKIFGVRAIVTNSLYLSVLSLLPLVLQQVASEWSSMCKPLGLALVLECNIAGSALSANVWSITSAATMFALLWQVGMQLFRYPKLQSMHDGIRIFLFYLLPAPVIFWTQLVNLDVNSAALSLVGVSFFAWAACGYFYLFLHAFGIQELRR